ncbi:MULTISPECIES: hypothetical protein [unclassified Streptomyces]|nr:MULTISPECIES: hypothetical protein [unclassified Streptomyces]WSC25176.1 hypothetical protein OIE60_36635 [Streptomyces sp. NBC_01766]
MKTTAKAPVTLDPKKVAAIQAKVSRLVGTGALTAAPHTYHH